MAENAKKSNFDPWAPRQKIAKNFFHVNFIKTDHLTQKNSMLHRGLKFLGSFLFLFNFFRGYIQGDDTEKKLFLKDALISYIHEFFQNYLSTVTINDSM